MRTLYLECNMGASGDMLMGALYELLSDSEKDIFIKNMNSLFPEDIMLHAAPSQKCGIWGTKMNVVILGQEGSAPGHRIRAAEKSPFSQVELLYHACLPASSFFLLFSLKICEAFPPRRK